MKITKTRLKQIIKEELENVLEKQLPSPEQERRRELKASLAGDRKLIRRGAHGEEMTGDELEKYMAACKRLNDSGINKYKDYMNCMDAIQSYKRGLETHGYPSDHIEP